MPIYPELNAIFIHIPKTAGGSVERLLKPYRMINRTNPLRRLTSNLPIRESADKACIRVHDTARWIRTKIGATAFDRTLRFTVVRHPYSRLISHYEFIRQNPRHHKHETVAKQDFEAFLDTRAARELQCDYICDRQGNFLVTEIARFETLHDDMNAIFAKLGTDFRMDEKRSNTSVRDDDAKYLTPAIRARLQDRYALDFERLGYEP